MMHRRQARHGELDRDRGNRRRASARQHGSALVLGVTLAERLSSPTRRPSATATRRRPVSAAPASALLAAVVVTALLAAHTTSVAVICLILLVVALRAPAKRRWPYLIGTLTSAVFVFALTPFVESIGSHPLWVGPTIPVIGQLDVTTEELRAAPLPGAAARRRRPRVRRLRAARRPRPPARLGRLGAPLGARRGARDPARPDARARRARHAARAARPRRQAPTPSA